jgi:hypothetical protein
MVSTKQQFRSRFADAVEAGDVISPFLDGAQAVEVIGALVRHKNVIGDRSYVRFPVRLIGTTHEEELIFPPSAVIYVRTTEPF